MDHSVLISRGRGFLENRRLETSSFFIYYTLLFIIFLLYYCLNNLPEDVANYYSQISSLAEGELPYRDFQFEYPPLVIIVFFVPKLFSWNLGSFLAVFMFQCYLAFLLCVYFGTRIADLCSVAPWKVHLFAAVVLLAMFRFILVRYDIFVALLVIIAIWLLVRKRYLSVFAVLGLGVMMKIYPVILIAMLVIFLLFCKRPRLAICGTAVSAAVCAAIEIPFLVADPSSAFDYLTYHADRGIQLESFYGALLEVYQIFVPGSVSVVSNYGSHNLVGGIADSIVPITAPLMVAAVIVFTVWAAYRLRVSGKGLDTGFVIIAFEIGILLAVGFSKVYSAQYFLWFASVFPLIHLALMLRSYLPLVYGAAISLTFFSALNGLFTYWDLVHLNPVGIVINVLKIVSHFLLTAVFIRIFAKETAAGGKDVSAGRVSAHTL